MVSAFVGALARHAIGDDYWVAWRRWYLGAAMASLIITPMIMYWALGGVEAVRSASSKRRVEAILLFGALILVGIIAMSGGVERPGDSPVLIYLPFPLLLYAAVRFGPRGASTALSLIAAAAIWNAEQGRGWFSGESAGGDILSLQLFLCVTAIPLLCVALLLYERERVAASLRETTARLARAESSSLVMATNIGLDGRWLKVPQTLSELLGYSKQELLAGNYKDITHPDDLEACLSQCQRLIDGEIRSFGLEKRFIHKDGHIVWTYLDCSLITDPFDRPVQLLTYIKDISRGRQAEDALRESELRFRTMADTAPVMIWMSGTDMLCNYVNRGWLDFTGRQIEQELGNRWADGVRPDDLDRIFKVYAAAVDARKSFSVEYHLRRYDGEYRRVLDTGVPRFTPDGTFAGYIGSALDITELKQAEQNLQRLTGQLIYLQDEERRRIAAELHDSLGQSLVIIKNRVLICERYIGDHDRITEQLGEISLAAESALDEVHEIAHNLRPYELDRLGLVRAVETMVGKLASSSSIHFSAELDRIDGILLPAAETSVYRIVQEGLNNVIKHAEATEARVSVKQVGGFLLISVSDNGKGIRAHERGTGNGHGIGLAGIAERARMFGGLSTIESDPERGTTLIVTIGVPEVENGRQR